MKDVHIKFYEEMLAREDNEFMQAVIKEGLRRLRADVELLKVEDFIVACEKVNRGKYP